jgi:glutamate synthase (ferredoxin)
MSARGLHDPLAERDACGIGFVTSIGRRPRAGILSMGLDGLGRMAHRGALAADQRSGDGAGVLIGISPAVFGSSGVAMAFLPSEDAERDAARKLIEQACREQGVPILEWRPVPTRPEALGEAARRSAPVIDQAILERTSDVDTDLLERRAFLARKQAEREARSLGLDLYVASISFRTLTYKAMCAADQLAAFYPDLEDDRFESSFCVFHQRYSTNTAPSWRRAQPFRLLCHNGEINTIQGNVIAMRSRSGHLGWPDPEQETLLAPLLDEDGSDSAMLDNALELMVRGGEDVQAAIATLVPRAWENAHGMPQRLRNFYRHQAARMEPWDGPAALIFTDGVHLGARLDRNGLRPLRIAVCEDGLIACASEAGAIEVGGHGSVKRGKLGPGQSLSVDLASGRLDSDAETAAWLGDRRPYGELASSLLLRSDPGEPAAESGAGAGDDQANLLQRQVAFGYTKEEFVYVLRPMALEGKEPVSSMGDDTAPAVLSQQARLVYGYLKQRFAQVTNPAIDHLRERGVMSLRTCLGARPSLLGEEQESGPLLELDTFVLFPSWFASLEASDLPLRHARLSATFQLSDADCALKAACERLAQEAESAVRGGASIVVLDDTGIDLWHAPIPAVLAVSAVHHHLVARGLRARVSLVVDTGDARETHHAACLLGYGADAICPRLALTSIAALAQAGRLGPSARDPMVAQERYVRALEDGVLKIMAKMGIATLDGYRGAQIFEAIGLDSEVIDRCLKGTTSPVGGIGFAALERQLRARHAAAFNATPELKNPGFFKHHEGGAEYHSVNPQVYAALQEAVAEPAAALGGLSDQSPAGAIAVTHPSREREVREAHALQRAVSAGPSPDGFARYARYASLLEQRPATELRDLLEPVKTEHPVALDAVEPVSAILRRFSTGAISHGSINGRTHETIALAMNRLGAKSNTGEGGEDPWRYRTQGSDRDVNSRIKQVASARFGVTAEYCAFAEELQIKIAQGSKPGEGGQLPGRKVTEEIARLRHTQPGVSLISPPPHHDIYSIEDLAQLIYDLKQVNPLARVSVKLVAEGGVGTVAAGVVKGLADIVHIAGSAGGTGASPLSSIKHAGLPWEIGLAETQQALRAAGLRDRVRLRVDGGIKCGRDVLIAALLGADEVSFGTAALLAEGCVMARTCHLDTCPAGIATQRPEVSEKFSGTPEMLQAYLIYVAEEVRQWLAGLGLRRLEDAIGRVDLLRPRPAATANGLDLRPLLEGGPGESRFKSSMAIQQPGSELGDRLVIEAFSPLREGRDLLLHHQIHNRDRAVGARLSGMLAREGDASGQGKLTVHFSGQAGQSFGAFLTAGITFLLEGEANDYVGKAMSGGRIVVRPPQDDAGDSVLLGNTVLYGATGGEVYCAGAAGERFAVRNSGAVAVVEGVGDHACEYMTGGTVVILGSAGDNLAAGMTGGEVFLDGGSDQSPMTVNRELVKAQRVSDDSGSIDRLHELIRTHAWLTGSSRAMALLAGWPEALGSWWRIVPRADLLASPQA